MTKSKRKPTDALIICVYDTLAAHELVTDCMIDDYTSAGFSCYTPFELKDQIVQVPRDEVKRPHRPGKGEMVAVHEKYAVPIWQGYLIVRPPSWVTCDKDYAGILARLMAREAVFYEILTTDAETPYRLSEGDLEAYKRGVKQLAVSEGEKPGGKFIISRSYDQTSDNRKDKRRGSQDTASHDFRAGEKVIIESGPFAGIPMRVIKAGEFRLKLEPVDQSGPFNPRIESDILDVRRVG